MNPADKSLAAMRKQVREADELALVNRRAYGIFRSMQEKADEAQRDHEIDFTLEHLRSASRDSIGKLCRWCQRKLTPKNISWDHVVPVIRGGSYSWENLGCICSVCNGQKGSTLAEEFQLLLDLLKSFGDKGRADVLRRLGLGARWRS
jgi:5-methylcytosine-specific restriction endonuclease McrA